MYTLLLLSISITQTVNQAKGIKLANAEACSSVKQHNVMCKQYKCVKTEEEETKGEINYWLTSSSFSLKWHSYINCSLGGENNCLAHIINTVLVFGLFTFCSSRDHQQQKATLHLLPQAVATFYLVWKQRFVLMICMTCMTFKCNYHA